MNLSDFGKDPGPAPAKNATKETKDAYKKDLDAYKASVKKVESEIAAQSKVTIDYDPTDPLLRDRLALLAVVAYKDGVAKAIEGYQIVRKQRHDDQYFNERLSWAHNATLAYVPREESNLYVFETANPTAITTNKSFRNWRTYYGRVVPGKSIPDGYWKVSEYIDPAVVFPGYQEWKRKQSAR